MRPLTTGDRSIHLVASVGTCALALALVDSQSFRPRTLIITPKQETRRRVGRGGGAFSGKGITRVHRCRAAACACWRATIGFVPARQQRDRRLPQGIIVDVASDRLQGRMPQVLPPVQLHHHCVGHPRSAGVQPFRIAGGEIMALLQRHEAHSL